jgi:tripartite-type tricarboxylate transporter receptor subunit TctC
MTFVDWVGVFAPAKTPTEVVAKLNKEIGAVLQEPAIIAKLESLSFAPMRGDAGEAQKEFDADLAKWRHLVTSLDLTLK